jgi:alpha-galactosidase
MSILPGTFEEMRSDVHEPEKYGIYQSVGDTAGPGGVLRAMRTVPIYQDYARLIAKICPDAWVINFTNPMSICMKALYDTFPQIKAFGCCHEVFHTQDFLCCVLAEVLGIQRPQRREIYTDVSGINHFTWITRAKYRDIDLLSLLPEFMDRYYESGYYEHGPANQYETDCFAYANRVKMNLYQNYGNLGAAGDRHLAEFMNNRWYLASPQQVREWKFALTTVDFRINQMNERIQESIELAQGIRPIELKKSDEEAVDLMRAIMGLGNKVSNVNMPNRGQMKDMPYGAIVETNAVFSADMVSPVTAAPLEKGVTALVLRGLYNIEECYEGIKNRDIQTIFNSFVNQALCSELTRAEAWELFVSMIHHTEKYLREYYDILP